MTSGPADVAPVPLWQPDAARVREANVTALIASLNQARGLALDGYDALHRFSVDEPDAFWSAVWDFVAVIGERGDGPALVEGQTMKDARWFPGARLNFAENLLRGDPSRIALTSWNETGRLGDCDLATLRADVAQMARALQAEGVVAGDRVAGYLPNIAETAIAMLAAASIGAAWSVCATDLSPAAVIDRFAQIEPTVLFVADGAWYGGQPRNAVDKGLAIAAALPGVRRVVAVPYLGVAPASRWRDEPRAVAWDHFVAPHSRDAFAFERFRVAQPLYVLYTSGTTGRPKCIVHGAGGTLLKHQVDHILQFDVRRGDTVLRVTGSGWMLWNSLMSVLAAEARVVLYDGSPLLPPSVILDIAAHERVTMLGLAPPVIEGWQRAGLKPMRSHELPALRAISAGGAPLSAETAEYVYRAVKRDVHLASPSGGTDIISFFVGGHPTGPVYAGQIQGAALGMAVDVLDEAGAPLLGHPGELVCRRPFPSMPIGFWDDEGDARYQAAYFDTYPGLWHHGDWAERTPQGGFVIHGRSDATLKSNGVRIGTAEIYAPVRAFPEVVEAIAIDQRLGGRSRVVLFLVLVEGHRLDGALEQSLRAAIAAHASPRHVPELLVAMPDVPRTANGKPSEMAARAAVHGERVANEESLADPAALRPYREFGVATRAADAAPSVSSPSSPDTASRTHHA